MSSAQKKANFEAQRRNLEEAQRLQQMQEELLTQRIQQMSVSNPPPVNMQQQIPGANPVQAGYAQPQQQPYPISAPVPQQQYPPQPQYSSSSSSVSAPQQYPPQQQQAAAAAGSFAPVFPNLNPPPKPYFLSVPYTAEELTHLDAFVQAGTGAQMEVLGPDGEPVEELKQARTPKEARELIQEETRKDAILLLRKLSALQATVDRPDIERACDELGLDMNQPCSPEDRVEICLQLRAHRDDRTARVDALCGGVLQELLKLKETLDEDTTKLVRQHVMYELATRGQAAGFATA